MNRLLAYFRRPSPSARPNAFPGLPESVAYAALLASGVDGAASLSFAEFVSRQGRTTHQQMKQERPGAKPN